MVKVQNPFAVALVNIADSQDIASFKKIFDYFSPRLKSFLMKSGAEEGIAEEIIQETMTIIWTKADYYDPKVASPSTWIYTIARNKKIDILRKTRKAILENIETAVLPPVESKADENIEHDQKFDLILMDMMMPEMNGLDATRKIRKWESEKSYRGHTTIWAMTANAQDQDQQDCLQAGMDAFISKPITRKALHEKLMELSGLYNLP